MDIKEAIYTRRSVRGYQSKPVEKAAIEQLIDAAIQAPTAMNTQPWAFAVIQDAATLKDISDRTKAHLLSKMDEMPVFETYREILESPDFNVFYGAPALVIICARPKVSPIAGTDCALAAENMMLAARSLGLGTCWIGFAAMYLSSPEAKRQFGIPEDYSVEAPIIVGYLEGEFASMEKNPPEMIYWR